MDNNIGGVKLQLDIAEIALRYEQKTAAIGQSVVFLLTAELEAKENTALRKAIDKFEKYLKPHFLDFHHHFAGLLLFNLISEVELYFVEVLRVLIRRYPQYFTDLG